MREQFNSSYHTMAACVPKLLPDTISYLPQQILSDQMVKAEQNECNDLFRLAFAVMEYRCRIIIDGRTCRNLVSSDLVEKLCLTTEPHPCPYYIQWPNSSDKF